MAHAKLVLVIVTIAVLSAAATVGNNGIVRADAAKDFAPGQHQPGPPDNAPGQNAKGGIAPANAYAPGQAKVNGLP
jgi:hypothetical protein